MGEYAAILTWTSIGAFVALLLVLFHVRVAPRRQPPAQSADPIDIVATLARFQLHAALFVSMAFLVLILAAWSAGVGVLGRTGLGVAALATAPLLVGFAHLASRRAGSAPGGEPRPRAPESPPDDEPRAKAAETAPDEEPRANAPESPPANEPRANAPESPRANEPRANAPESPPDDEPRADAPQSVNREDAA